MSQKEEVNCLKSLFRYLDECSNILSNCDINVIKQLLCTAKHNEETEFPDFIIDGGCIEHFQVTSSKEDHHGSKFRMEKSKKDNNGYTHTTINHYSDFSYDDFLSSLERNIKKHINSLEKSVFKDKTVIFLIEQPTARMFLKQRNSFYELMNDKNALTIIKNSCKNVDYLIYFVADSIEVLDLSKIDELILNSFDQKDVDGGRLKELKQVIEIDVDILNEILNVRTK